MNRSSPLKKIPARCRYWQTDCPYGGNCKYVHPSARCNKQPNCQYGRKCFFIHDDEIVPGKGNNASERDASSKLRRENARLQTELQRTQQAQAAERDAAAHEREMARFRDQRASEEAASVAMAARLMDEERAAAIRQSNLENDMRRQQMARMQRQRELEEEASMATAARLMEDDLTAAIASSSRLHSSDTGMRRRQQTVLERDRAEEASEVAALEAARDIMLLDFAEHGGIVPREERERMREMVGLLEAMGIDNGALTRALKVSEGNAGMLGRNIPTLPSLGIHNPFPSAPILPAQGLRPPLPPGPANLRSPLPPSQRTINTSSLLLPLPGTPSTKGEAEKVVDDVEDALRCDACHLVKDVNICLTCRAPTMCKECIVTFASRVGNYTPGGKFGYGATTCSRCRAPWKLEGNSSTGFIAVTGGLADAAAGIGKLRNNE